MIVNDAPRKAITSNQTPIPWDEDWHTVKIERDYAAGTIRVFFDDMEHPVMEATDRTFGAGRIGIGSFDDMNEFDDVRLITREP